MSTFLEMCQNLVGELGIGNGTISSVENQVGELANVVRWVRQSALDVENLWQDWKFHWTEYFGVLATNGDLALDRFAPAPNSPAGVLVRRWDETSFWLEKQSTQAQPLKFVPWAQFRTLYDVARDDSLPSKPTVVTIRPDNTLQMFPVPDGNYTLSGEFYRRPVAMLRDIDTSAVPAEYHRIIECRAAIKYANKEDAPEIISGMESEYIDIIEKLQSDQLEAFSHERRAGQSAGAFEGSIPGM